MLFRERVLFPLFLFFNFMQKNIFISLFAAFVIIGGAMFFAFRGDISASSPVSAPKQKQENIFLKEGANIKIKNEVQIISIGAKGGYFPRKTVAKAGRETLLRIQTSGTYDCSAALIISKMNFRKFLAPEGVEEILIPAAEANGILRGVCSMGMYGFEVEFK